MSSIPDFWAVIPAGGSGTRLWPLSRAGHPKFLHDLTGEGHTLIQGTVDRVAPLAADRVVVVTGVAHAEAVRAQLPGLTPTGCWPSPARVTRWRPSPGQLPSSSERTRRR